MAKKKQMSSLSDFSPSYRKRIESTMKRSPGLTVEQAREKIYSQRVESKARRNPDATLAEARGHKPPPLPETATNAEKQRRALQEKASALSLQAKTGQQNPEKIKEAQKILRQMDREVKRMQKEEAKGIGEKPSDLQWTLWSQQQKERQIQADNLLSTIKDPDQEKAQKAFEKIKTQSEKLKKMKEGTKRYEAAWDRLERANASFEASGFAVKEGAVVRRAGENPVAEKALKILDRMQEVTKNMWEKHPPGKPSYYRDQERLAALYKRLEKLGLVHRTGDILQGDVGYH